MRVQTSWRDRSDPEHASEIGRTVLPRRVVRTDPKFNSHGKSHEKARADPGYASSTFRRRARPPRFVLHGNEVPTVRNDTAAAWSSSNRSPVREGEY